jgi:3-oxoacyl-[acyl-carrier-protein] synthase-3
MSAIINYEDRNTCILFGDGAGAVLLEPSAKNGHGIIDFSMHTDGSGDKFLYVPGGGSLNPASHETVYKRLHFIYQEGKAVFKHAITGLSKSSAQLLGKNRLNGNDVNLFIPHQANARIIKAVAEKLGLDSDRVVMNIDRYGNTTAATIPLAMSEAYQEGKMKAGDLILLSAFGAGFTWGSILLEWAMN